MSILNYILTGVVVSAIAEYGYNRSKLENKKSVSWFDRILIIAAWPIAAVILLLGILIGDKKNKK
jgi:hypothetical protein